MPEHLGGGFKDLSTTLLSPKVTRVACKDPKELLKSMFGGINWRERFALLALAFKIIPILCFQLEKGEEGSANYGNN